MAELLSIDVLLPWLLGMIFGVFVGATPGLTATMAVALIVPISFHLEPAAGLALIIGVSFTAIFAGDIPATWLRIPGTPASAAAVLDGHEMAKKGEGKFALTLNLFCSCIGGLIGVLALILIAPQLAKFAIKFTHYEKFWLAALGLSICLIVSRNGVFRALVATLIGLMISTIGIEESAAQRFTFGQADLFDGFSQRGNGAGFIPVLIGLFGLSEVFKKLSQSDEQLPAAAGGGSGEKLRALGEIWRKKWTVLKSSIAGLFLGALPGAGADVAAWGAYGLAQKTSKNPEKFGTGCTEGVVAPTSANNAAVAGAWIPALVFGVPGDAVTAIVLGALLMYGIQPGPEIFTNNAEQVQTIFWIALITQFLLLIAGAFGIRAFGLILKLPRSVVLTAVVVFSVIGAFAIRSSMFDVYVMIAAGVLGFSLERARVPLAPLILGLILGPMLEENLRTGLIKSGGSFTPFLTRPISLTLASVLALAFVAGPALRLITGLKKGRFARR
ncbi:MAG: putative tricarboxylic transport membrane protein [Verrucomicrobiales bacterium]|jgi:putative tricarboxylic transport membrane protein